MVQRLAPFVFLLAACEGGSGPVPLTELSTVYAEVSCAKLYECCTEEEVMQLFDGVGDPPTNEAECQAYLGGFLSLGVSQLMMSEAAGRLRYHPEMAGACVDSIRDVSCAEYRGGLAPMGATATCEAVFEPLVAEGGTCTSNTECTTASCESMGSEDGTCVALPGRDAPCTFDCAEGLYCDFDGMERTCQPTRAEGAVCDGDEQCASRRCAGADPTMGVSGTCDIAGASVCE